MPIGNTMPINTLLLRSYAFNKRQSRNLILRIIKRLEKGEFYSQTLRVIFKTYYNVEIGMYTHGGCFVPNAFDPFTKVGRYCSIAKGTMVFNRNHPTEFKSTHAFFFNSKLGYCNEDKIEYHPLTIGNDVWIGTDAKILANVKQIGDGAVVGANAVLNRDIPPYAIAIGNPARIAGYRFDKDIIEKLLESRWWEKSIEELIPNLSEYQQPYLNFLGTSKEI
jgi:virginiamycin A acetyltransferase